MNKINRHNYESYFLDYLEGNLDRVLESELLLFLEKNADLAGELNRLKEDADDPVTVQMLPFETLDDDVKNALKKSVLPLSSEELANLIIGRMEGDLADGELKRLQQLETDYPEVRKESALFELTRLIPDNSTSDLYGALYFPAEIDLTDPKMAIIAKMEGDLSPSQQKNIDHLIASTPSLKADETALKRARLQQETIVYPDKKKLYQHATGRVITLRRYFTYTAAAASVALMIWLGAGNDPKHASFAGRLELNTPAIRTSGNTGVTHNESLVPVASGAHKSKISTGNRNSFAPDNEHIASNVTSEKTTVVVPIKSKSAAAFVVKSKVPDLAPDMEKVHDQLAVKQPQPTVSPNGTGMTIWEFAEKKAKETVWGGSDYPDDKFAFAFVQKEIDRRFDPEETKMQVERISTPGIREFRVRLGKFKYTRKRNIQ